MKKQAFIFTLAAALLALAAFGAVWSTSSHAQKEDTVVASGTVEGTEVDINSKIPGRIIKLPVSEGDRVEAGQVLAKISDDELKAKEAQAIALADAARDQLDQAVEAAKLQKEISRTNLARANAAMAAAQAQLTKARQGARTQELAQAQANYDLWWKTHERVQRLFDQGAVPAQKLDEVKTQLEVAKQTLSMAKEGARQEDVQAAQALLDQAKSGVEAANAGLLQVKMAGEQVEAARAKYRQALGGLREVQAYLKDTELKAPVSGTVTSLTVDAGELISTGMPVATVTDTANLWVEVKVKETDLAKIHLGQKATVLLAGNPGSPLSGEVVRIAKKPDFATKRATNDRGEQDILAYGVKVKVANPANLPAVGATATVEFDLSPGGVGR